MPKRKRDRDDIIKTANQLSPPDFVKQHHKEGKCKLKCEPTNDREKDPEHDQHKIFEVKFRFSQQSAHEAHKDWAISDDTLEQCLGLIEKTSAEDYALSSIGWNQKRKLKEMSDKDMRFLVAYRGIEMNVLYPITATGMQGFLSFMLTYEDGLPVIYIYEIHLRSYARGLGLGKHLLEMVEDVGRSVGVDKCMLTVFLRNECALKWYGKMGYEVDEFSPQPKKLRAGRVKEPDYQILSKSLKDKADEPNKKRSCKP